MYSIVFRFEHATADQPALQAASCTLLRAVFVVNGGSGAGAGAALGRALRLAGADFVRGLAAGDLREAVEAAVSRGGVLVACGGDGTASAVLDAVASLPTARQPPVAVVPLGTGNDLARVLWVEGLHGLDEVPSILARLARARMRHLDRWLLDLPDGRSLAWFNYCSWGADARIARRFELVRRQHPPLAHLGRGNRLLYAGLGLIDRARPLSLRWRGAEQAPEGASCLLCAAIGSYSGGARLPVAPDLADGRMEVFALPAPRRGVPALFRGRRPRLLGRVGQLDLDLAQAGVMQLDGEANSAPAGRYRIRHAGTVPVLTDSRPT